MKGTIIWIGALLILLSVTTAHASVPPLMSYQGKLTDETGVSVSDGDYTVQFRIYTAPSGGDLLWDEEQTVTVEDGLFSVLLGDVDFIPDTVFTGPIRYLALQVSPDPEMSTRKPIVSVGYAFHSLHSDTAEYALSGGGGGSNWTVTDSVLYTNNYWGIARGGAGNILYGDSAHTMVNLGVACTTGTAGHIRTYATVSGGYGNTASGWSATVGGGNNNVCSRRYATVSGGSNNTVSGADAGSGTVGGGDNNTVSGVDAGCGTVGGGSYNTVSDDYATVSGGYLNEANSFCATVGGGMDNTASSSYSVVGGGQFNAVTEYAFRATIGGGQYDTTKAVYGGVFSGYSNLAGDTEEDTAAFVGGGYDNSAIGKYATVGGGFYNRATDHYATIGGGYSNLVTFPYSTVGGGYTNTVMADYATVPGGYANATLGDYSFVAGRQVSLNIGADYTFAFGRNFSTSTPNAVIFHNSSSEIKVGIGLTNPGNILSVQQGSTTDPIADSWGTYSSRRWKTNIEPISEALEKVKKLRGVYYDWEADGKHDIGMIAEEVGEVLPEVVAYEENGEDARSLDYARLVALLVEAVKELEQKNEVLTERVKALERAK